MAKNNNPARALWLAASSLAAIGLAPGLVYAQAPAAANPASEPAAPDNSDVIVVTASRISQSAIVDQPVSTLKGSQIEQLGYTNVGTALM
jgi:hypothetical protein